MFGNKPKDKKKLAQASYCCESCKPSDQAQMKGFYLVCDADASEEYCFIDPYHALNFLCLLIEGLALDNGDDAPMPTLEEAFDGDFYGADHLELKYIEFEDAQED